MLQYALLLLALAQPPQTPTGPTGAPARQPATPVQQVAPTGSTQSTANQTTSPAQAAAQADTACVSQACRELQITRASTRELWLTILALAIYVFTVMMARWHHIAQSMHHIILAQLAALDTRLHVEVGAVSPEVMRLRKQVDDLMKQWKPEKLLWRSVGDAETWRAVANRIAEFLIWSRGRENATWIEIHEIERQLASFLAPPSRVEAYLQGVEAELRALQHPDAIAIADGIRAQLSAPAGEDAAGRKRQQEIKQALLGRAIGLIYRERDMQFASLMEWQNKSSWLGLTAVVIIGFVVGIAGHAILFLAGAAGGFVSRLMRALRRDNIPLDYGASWSTLLLSPLFGALVGWFGIALIKLATAPGVNLLGTAFDNVRWAEPDIRTVGLAFLLGFSERLFDSVVNALERNADQPTRAVGSAATTGERGAKRSDGGKDTAAGAASKPTPLGPGAVPSIAEVSRDLDSLVITGARFASNATAKVNEEPHPVTFESSELLLLPLSPKDIEGIEEEVTLIITVENPGGGVSNPAEYREAAE